MPKNDINNWYFEEIEKTKDPLERHLLWWVWEQQFWEESETSTTLQDQATELLNQYRKLIIKLKNLKSELNKAIENNKQRNLELDILHYIWCSGGCETGIHRHSDISPLTLEQVQTAIRYVERLQEYYINVEFKKLPLNIQKEYHELKKEQEHRILLEKVIDWYADPRNSEGFYQGYIWTNNLEIDKGQRARKVKQEICYK